MQTTARVWRLSLAVIPEKAGIQTRGNPSLRAVSEPNNQNPSPASKPLSSHYRPETRIKTGASAWKTVQAPPAVIPAKAGIQTRGNDCRGKSRQIPIRPAKLNTQPKPANCHPEPFSDPRAK
jgi:hypothetical protein